MRERELNQLLALHHLYFLLKNVWSPNIKCYWLTTSLLGTYNTKIKIIQSATHTHAPTYTHTHICTHTYTHAHLYTHLHTHLLWFYVLYSSDSLLIPVINCGTSIYAGFAIFSVLGYLADAKGLPIQDVAEGGNWCALFWWNCYGYEIKHLGHK